MPSRARIYAEVIRNPSLLRVQAAFLLFTAAEYAIWIAVTIFAYEDGGATTAGLVLLAQLLPAALLAPVVATIGDRFPRGRALAYGYGAQMLAAAGLATAMWLAPPLVAYGAAVVSSIAVTLTRPVHYAILPDLAQTPEQLTAANSLSNTMEGLGILIGPLSTTPLIFAFGPASVPGTYSAVLVLAVLLCLSLPREPVPENDGAGEAGLLLATAQGVRALLGDPPAAVLTLLGGSQYVVIGLLDVFYAILAVELLGAGEHVAGLLAATFGVGGLIGAALTVILVGRRRLSGPVVGALVVTGLAIAPIAGAGSLLVVGLLLVAAGAARAFFDVGARTLLQRSLHRDVIARVFGLQEGLIMLGLAIGSVMAPILVAILGPSGALIAVAGAVALAGLVSWGALRVLDGRATLVDDRIRELIGEIPVFAPLPAFELEDVCRQLVHRSVQPGDVVIREGDTGDSFYVVADGSFAVRTGDREVATVSRGGYFGEIALLRDVPRTADVVATTEGELLALTRDDFLSAVSGGRRLPEAASDEIDRRLEELRASRDRHSTR